MTEENTPERIQQEQAVELLNKMLDLLGMDSSVTLESFVGETKLAIDGGQAGRLIGRRGQTLEALELILNRILKKNEDAVNRLPWISLVVDGYAVEAPHSERERPGRLPRTEVERLEALARDVAKEVKMQHAPRVIGPYAPAERRVIHLALINDPDVETVSDSEADANRGKKITVRLKSN